MNKEKKDGIIVLLGYLCIVCIFLYLDFGGFVKYKMHSEEYQVLKVKIIDTNIYAKKHSDTAYFYYYDNGERKRGATSLNYNEKKGDYIDIAFDENMNYVRTQIALSITGMWHWLMGIIIGIGLLHIEYKTFKKE